MRPASSGGHPQRGRPTSTSTSTSRMPPRAAAVDRRVGVDGDGDARVELGHRAQAVGVDRLVGEQEVVAEPARGEADQLARRRAGEAADARDRAAGARARCTCAPSRAAACARPAAPRPSSRGCARARSRRRRARAWAGRRRACVRLWHVVSPSSVISAEDRPPVAIDFHTADLPATPTRDFLIPATRWVEAPESLRTLGARLRCRPRRVQAAHQTLPPVAGRSGPRRRRLLHGDRGRRPRRSSTRSASFPTAPAAASGPTASSRPASAPGRKPCATVDAGRPPG